MVYRTLSPIFLTIFFSGFWTFFYYLLYIAFHPHLWPWLHFFCPLPYCCLAVADILAVKTEERLLIAQYFRFHLYPVLSNTSFLIPALMAPVQLFLTHTRLLDSDLIRVAIVNQTWPHGVSMCVTAQLLDLLSACDHWDCDLWILKELHWSRTCRKMNRHILSIQVARKVNPAQQSRCHFRCVGYSFKRSPSYFHTILK